MDYRVIYYKRGIICNIKCRYMKVAVYAGVAYWNGVRKTYVKQHQIYKIYLYTTKYTPLSLRKRLQMQHVKLYFV